MKISFFPNDPCLDSRNKQKSEENNDEKKLGFFNRFFFTEKMEIKKMIEKKIIWKGNDDTQQEVKLACVSVCAYTIHYFHRFILYDR